MESLVYPWESADRSFLSTLDFILFSRLAAWKASRLVKKDIVHFLEIPVTYIRHIASSFHLTLHSSRCSL